MKHTDKLLAQYATLDKLIVDRLRSGPMFLHLVFTDDVKNECRRLAGKTGREAFRIIDARLQALRKAGVIAFDSKAGWGLK